MNRFSRILLAVIGLALLFGGFANAPVTAQDTASAEQQLAERYVPVAYLRYQAQACGVPPYEGEPYVPLPVEMILNNDRILVRDSETREVLATGVTAQELATYGPDTYLDFPGNPLRPGCTYETDERVRIADKGLTPSTYAHIVFDEENNRLALQYWFYWYFNDWNNTHESDWEGIQVMWNDVDSVEAALETPPTHIGYSQHGNGEMANWGDDKVQLEDGTHPRVYPAAGSHATFFSNDTFLAWGERNSGFGCDVSSPKSVRTPLDVILVPNEIDPNGEFAWLLYEGRWGEQQRGPYNGPIGPMHNNRWSQPFEAFETWRPFSIVVPTNTAVGPSMAEAFCTLTANGSQLILDAKMNPLIYIPTVIVAAAALFFFVRGSMPIFRRARKLYRENFKLFFGIGLVSLPLGIAFNLLQAFLITKQPLAFVVDWLDNTGGANLTAVMAVGGVQQLAMVLIITPAIIYAVKQVHAGNRITPSMAYQAIITRMSVVFISLVAFILVAMVLLFSVIGLPIAIWLAVQFSFFVQVLIYDETATPMEAFRESFRLVKGSWWNVLSKILVFNLIAVLPGIVVGFGLLTLGRTAVGFANGISSLLYAVLMPLAVIAVTLLYLDRKAATPDAEVPAEKPVIADETLNPGTV